MLLTDLSLGMGTVHFTSGSHCNGLLGELPVCGKSEERFTGETAKLEII